MIKRSLIALGSAGVGGFMLLMVLMVGVLIGAGYCWDYSVSYWLGYFGKPDNFTLLHGVLIALLPIIGELSIPFAVVTLIFSQVLGG